MAISSTTPAAASADGNNNNNNNSNNKSRQIPIVCPGHTRPLAELQFCHVTDGDEKDHRTLLVSACHDRLPMLRDGSTGDWIGTFAGHKGAVWSCKLDPSASLAATASGDFSVKVWDAVTGSCLHSFAHLHIVKTCDFSPNSQRLATGGHEGILRIFNLTQMMLPSNTNTNKQQATTTATPMQILHRDQGTTKNVTITKLCWKSDHEIVTGGDDGKIRFWNIPESNNNNDNDNNIVQDAAPTHVLETEEGAEIRDLELKTNSQGAEILTVATGTMVYFFDVSSTLSSTLLYKYKMPIHFRDEGGASLHPSENKFIAGGSDLWVRVFDLQTGRELECLKGHHGPIRCLRYSQPDGRSFASGSEDGTIRLWKTIQE